MMRQVILIEGANRKEYVDTYNEVTAELSRCNIVDQYHLSETATYLYYETDESDPEWMSRKCVECSYYDWGKGCLLTGKRRNRLDSACQTFTTEYVDTDPLEENNVEVRS